MQYSTYLFDIIAMSFIAYAFCREREGLSAMLIRGPWNIFQSSFRKQFDVQCKIEAKKIMRKHPGANYASNLNTTIFITLFIMLFTSALSIQFCDWPVSVVFILYHLYRMPLNMSSAFRIKEYLENPKAIGNVA